jgi:photosystem II stability/assembly factor-like uncharacterized protein
MTAWQAGRRERIIFLHEQRGNVIENKGPLLEMLGRSWNVIDSKADNRRNRECNRKQRR